MAHAPRLLVSMLGLTLVAAGCGGKQVEDTPPPAPEMAPVPAPAPVSTPAPVDRQAPAPDNRRSTLEERIHFALDRADLTPEARTSLTAKAEILRSSPGLTLRIDGHADERGSDEYNLALSKRRAAEAKRFMMGQGIDAARLETVGYGEEQPMDRGAGESAWAMNRRADFRVTGGAVSQR
ncbi:MAG: OmpA family protein [Gemmatimonadales bacterium]